MIDDRKTEKAFEIVKKNGKEKQKDPIEAPSGLKISQKQKDLPEETKHPLFKKQDLWGLDKTRISIEKQGFGFHIVVINEEKTEDFDAFGEIVKQRIPPSTQKEDEHEEGEIFCMEAYPPIQKGDQSKESSMINIETGRVEECQNDIVFSPEISLNPEQTQKSFKSYFDTAIAHSLNSQKIQKIEYTGMTNQEEGLHQEYITCPTRDDGNGFFHAAFTDPEKCVEDVQERATEMRIQFVNMIKSGKYLHDMSHLLYESYSELHSNNQRGTIPSSIRQKFDANSAFELLKASVRQTRINLETHLAPKLFEEFDRECIFTPEQIKAEFTKEEIVQCIEPLCFVGGPNTFIPVRKDMMCPAEIIAENNDANINVFTFNQTKQSLDLLKSIRSPKEAFIINVLLEGSHFTRLHSRDDPVDQLQQAIQIIKNSGVEEFKEVSWVETDRSGKNYNEALMGRIDKESSFPIEGELDQRKKRKPNESSSPLLSLQKG